MTVRQDDKFDNQSSEAITLVVAWPSNKKIKLRQVAISSEIASAFRGVIDSAMFELNQREGQVWAPDADLSPETFLTISEADLGSAPALAAEHGEQTLFGALKSAESLPVMDPEGLPAGDLTFYALVVGDSIGSRHVFLRRSNPRRGLKRGRIYSMLSDTLQRIEEPIFAFDEWVDLICIEEEIHILSQTVFAALFRGQDALTEQVPRWTEELKKVVSLADEGRSRLEAKAQRDSRIRARLEAIVHRGHLESVTEEVLRSAMAESGLDASRLINSSGEFLLEEEDIPQVLYFLNEDLFSGSITKVGFRADKKAAR